MGPERQFSALSLTVYPGTLRYGDPLVRLKFNGAHHGRIFEKDFDRFLPRVQSAKHLLYCGERRSFKSEANMVNVELMPDFRLDNEELFGRFPSGKVFLVGNLSFTPQCGIFYQADTRPCRLTKGRNGLWR